MKEQLDKLQKTLDNLSAQRSRVMGKLDSLKEQRSVVINELKEFGITTPQEIEIAKNEIQNNIVILQKNIDDLIAQLPTEVQNAVKQIS